MGRQVRARADRRRGALWFARSPLRVALVAALALGIIVTVTPANGAATDIADGFVRAVQNLASSSSHSGQVFT